MIAPALAPNILRPYQETAIQAWFAFLDRGGQRGLIVSATGTGKNTILTEIVAGHCRADLSVSALVMAHQRELLHQTQATFTRQAPWLSTGMEVADSKCPRGARVALASVQSIGSPSSTRLDWLSPGVLVVDEGHHGAAKSYQNAFRRFGCYEDDGTPLLGVTATPHRLDQLALYGSERAIFQELVFSYDIVQAIRDGFLVDLCGYRAVADFDLSKVKIQHGDYNQGQLERAVNTEPVNELAFKSWSEVAADRPTIVFCAGVDHAKGLAKLFCDHGVKAEAVWGDMPASLRDATLRRFNTGETHVLTNMALLTEGFDAVRCSCVVQLRPTQSWTLFTQMVGRGLRVIPSVIAGIGVADDRREAVARSAKADCIVIDIVANTQTHNVAAKPDDGTTPSLQGLVGLPSALDLEGLTLAQAVDEFDKLPDFVKAGAFRRQTSFSGLSAQLTQVEMLCELEVPQVAQEAGVRLCWLKTGDLEYTVDLGSSVGPSAVRRVARLVGDFVGNWSLHYAAFDGHRPLRDEVIDLRESDVRSAFQSAEASIRRSFPGCMRLGDREAPWRSQPPTDDQARALRDSGVDPVVIEEMTRGVASQMLTALSQRVGHLTIMDGGRA